MNRRFRLGIALAALALHLIAPVAAYAAVPAGSRFADFCSVSGNAAPVGGWPADLPLPQPDRHLPSHCELCLGAAAAALGPPALPFLLFVATLGCTSPIPPPVATAAPTLFPPPRGPPANLTVA